MTNCLDLYSPYTITFQNIHWLSRAQIFALILRSRRKLQHQANHTHQFNLITIATRLEDDSLEWRIINKGRKVCIYFLSTTFHWF